MLFLRQSLPLGPGPPDMACEQDPVLFLCLPSLHAGLFT